MPIYHDITVPVSPEVPPWPGDAPTEIVATSRISEGASSNVSRLCFSSHAATHVDAPSHFIRDGKTLECMPMDALIGPAWVAEFPEPDVVDEADLEALVPIGVERLLLKTRNSRLWARARREFVTDFVHITPAAAEWIVRRKIRLVGIDYLSIQQFDAPEPATHRTLLTNDVVILEGVNLLRIQPGPYHLICLPLLVTGCDGAPARVVLAEE